ncbi:hypothetical protein AB0I91_13845 [Actinosynnema sp. NPDC049800]
MGESRYISSAVVLFEYFVRDTFPEPLAADMSVEKVLYTWLTEGGQAVEHCSGDFHIFQAAVAVIFAKVLDAHRRGEQYLTLPRGIPARTDPDDPYYGEIFDPYTFIGIKDELRRGNFG